MDATSPSGRYRILEGVHRCVAAYLAGRTEIAARVDDGGGSLGPVLTVPLAAIVSPKSEIGRRDRGRDFQVLIDRMADDAERGRVEPVELLAVSERVAKRLTPVASVEVRDE